MIKNVFLLGKGVAGAVKKAEKQVETNPEILANYCCINYRINEQPIKLKENQYVNS